MCVCCWCCGLFRIRVTYILRDGSKKDVEADIGDNVLELAHKHDIDLEGGDAIAL